MMMTLTLLGKCFLVYDTDKAYVSTVSYFGTDAALFGADVEFRNLVGMARTVQSRTASKAAPAPMLTASN